MIRRIPRGDNRAFLMTTMGGGKMIVPGRGGIRYLGCRKENIFSSRLESWGVEGVGENGEMGERILGKTTNARESTGDGPRRNHPSKEE